MFIWGNRDPAVGRKAVELQEAYILGPNSMVELDAEHWLLETRTEIVIENVMHDVHALTDIGLRCSAAM